MNQAYGGNMGVAAPSPEKMIYATTGVNVAQSARPVTDRATLGSALDELHSALCILHDQFNVLNEKLAWVSLPEGQVLGVNPNNPPETIMAEPGAICAIKSARDKVANLTVRTVNLIDRLAL